MAGCKLGETMAPLFPYFVRGKVVKMFGRGSKDLGYPTGKLYLHN